MVMLPPLQILVRTTFLCIRRNFIDTERRPCHEIMMPRYQGGHPVAGLQEAHRGAEGMLMAGSVSSAPFALNVMSETCFVAVVFGSAFFALTFGATQ
jgi:hypothetical protein